MFGIGLQLSGGRIEPLQVPAEHSRRAVELGVDLDDQILGRAQVDPVGPALQTGRGRQDRVEAEEHGPELERSRSSFDASSWSVIKTSCAGALASGLFSNRTT